MKCQITSLNHLKKFPRKMAQKYIRTLFVLCKFFFWVVKKLEHSTKGACCIAFYLNSFGAIHVKIVWHKDSSVPWLFFSFIDRQLSYQLSLWYFWVWTTFIVLWLSELKWYSIMSIIAFKSTLENLIKIEIYLRDRSGDDVSRVWNDAWLIS